MKYREWLHIHKWPVRRGNRWLGWTTKIWWWFLSRIPSQRETIIVRISNLTMAQRIALEDLFWVWGHLASLGSSRWTKFYADGDGDFHPKITVNGEKPEPTKLVSVETKWPDGHHGDYQIDFDWIAWKLHD